MIKVENTALAYHRVVVELFLKALPQLHRPFVEGKITGKQIVRANYRCISTDVARPDITFFDDGNARDAVFLCKVVSGCEAMSAAANYDNLVEVLWRCFSPKRFRPTVSEKRVGEDTKGRIAHDFSTIDLGNHFPLENTLS